ncbi:TPA: nicotinate-nucleotide--dimethylbenzimidazole phosphoribosyltransferase [Thermoplasmata archaeon]|nr:nicotinate-nucleotide--dimethylbenzimidazole phosphoribosyltransferase [Thermoplasmata archaeon]
MRTIGELVRSVRPLDTEAMSRARVRQDSLTKPRGSLGKLEDLSVRLAGVLRTDTPSLGGKVVFTMAADHGVTEEGVSAYPQEVTRQMVLNFANGGAAINVLARSAGAEVRVVDMGVAADSIWPECILNRKIAKGTRNMCKGPAMSLDEATRAVLTGAELVTEAVSGGSKAIAVGDMGIGNTTAASAITAAITGSPVLDVTGRGTGVDDRSLSLKVRAIERALNVNSPDPEDGLDVLAKVGGFEIGGIAGAVLGAASAGVPVFIDGFVSSSAALLATAMEPKCGDYIVASHLSVEPGHNAVLEHMELEPLLDLDMRLGEGTGAVLAFMLADCACRVLNEMATFDGAGVSKSDKVI